ncbi:histidine phosphatase family protein [Acidocella sp.]|uniref:histidine phosphatase family protein n=1 Tax=Acidocella sp. TaxID=50710 RepID=UPI002633C431|nr:histidine phosphatase family protein [Acidocella sp.]
MPAAKSNSALRCTTDAQAGRLLLFVRHGHTAWMQEGRYQGRSDTPLSEAGHEEARRLAKRLDGENLAAIYTSPLRRAHETARHIARFHPHTPFATDERLTEIGFGDWEGRTQADIRATTPEALRRWKRDPGGMRFPGGETLAEAQNRLHEFLSALPPDGGPALVVTHAGMIRLARLAAEDREIAAFRTIAVPTAGVTRLILAGTTVLRPAGIISEFVE